MQGEDGAMGPLRGLCADRRGWEGPRVAVLSILGFGVVLFSYTIVNLYFSRAHSFR